MGCQDLLQELYLRILRTDRAGTGDIHNPEVYLFAIASNLVTEHATRKRRSPPGDDALEQVIERLATPCDAPAGVDRELRRHRLPAHAQVSCGAGHARSRSAGRSRDQRTHADLYSYGQEIHRQGFGCVPPGHDAP